MTRGKANSKQIFARYRGKFVHVGNVEDGIFSRTCRSHQLYRAMGGSLGVDDSVLAQLKAEGVETLRVRTTDEKRTYTISLDKFLSLAKPRDFFGTRRWHLPFVGYWDDADRAAESSPDTDADHRAEAPKPQQLDLFDGQISRDAQRERRLVG